MEVTQEPPRSHVMGARLQYTTALHGTYGTLSRVIFFTFSVLGITLSIPHILIYDCFCDML